jgi:hypothetical protein
MKQSTLERIDSRMFESLDPDQQAGAVGGVITMIPTSKSTQSPGGADTTPDKMGDLPIR